MNVASDQPVAFVTGASRGIGRFVAERLAADGYAVFGCSRFVEETTRNGVELFPADVTNEEAIKRLLSRIRRQRGRLDAVIHCAGVATMNHALLTPTSTAEDLLRINVTGAFVVCREAAKLMRRRNFGRIVVFSSIAVPLRTAGEAVYVASKCAVEGLAGVLARELAPHGITINVVGPGPVDTDMTRGVPPATLATLLERTATGKMTTLEDIANAVEFFLRPESGGVTGQTLYVG